MVSSKQWYFGASKVVSETSGEQDTTIATGTVIAARYRVDKMIGHGGMGAVYKAQHILTERVVALKTLLPRYVQDTQVVGRFVREAKAASAVQHPNAIEIIDVFVDGELPFLVMEYLDGKSLGARLREEERLSVEETAKIMVPVLSALGTAHSKKIVHRDLKPDNIFLAIDPATGLSTPKVLDFGIAKVLRDEIAGGESARLTQTGALLGTPLYMAPEQISGRGKLDHRADLWSIGVVLYELLTGTLPFQGENFGHVFAGILQDDPEPPIALNPAISAELNAMILQCLAKRPAERPDSCGAIASVLARLADVSTYTIPPPSRITLDGSATHSIDAVGETLSADSVVTNNTILGGETRAPTQRIRQMGAGWAVWLAGGLVLLGGMGLVARNLLASRPTNPGDSLTAPQNTPVVRVAEHDAASAVAQATDQDGAVQRSDPPLAARQDQAPTMPLAVLDAGVSAAPALVARGNRRRNGLSTNSDTHTNTQTNNATNTTTTQTHQGVIGEM